MGRKSWEVESSKDSKSWKTDGNFEEFLKRKKVLMKKMGSNYISIPGSILNGQRLDQKTRSCGWDLIPIIGGKVRIGTDASFNTERT